ncbi:hypothetical protein WOLCODRAFT_166779 [Wolfiporia cocos MD-104 SS10]|uniref:Uncharacterized protein n=1 Tax=Wolfiporia cocos (strain MD-104) TaxID=742152 RepID=A0A2H3J8W5_WOLCO|nr:hypothetical protein WOLCODRAFT_166779 [Wolfiporia cocos MD-104 SS10]
MLGGEMRYTYCLCSAPCCLQRAHIAPHKCLKPRLNAHTSHAHLPSHRIQNSRMARAWDIYARLLSQKGYGYPLWSPEPLEQGEIDIGDVGWIQDGRFIRLINTFESPQSPINEYWKSLRDFETLDRTALEPFIINQPRRITADVLLSNGISKVDVGAGIQAMNNVANLEASFKCSSDQAVLLMLPSGQGDERSLIRSEQVTKFIKRNHENWYHMARDDVGVDITRDDLIFVTGWIKTSAWLIAACSHSARGVKIGLSGGSSGVLDLSLHGLLSKELNTGWEHRRSHSVITGKTDARNDQCIFVKLCKVRSCFRGFMPVVRWRRMRIPTIITAPEQNEGITNKVQEIQELPQTLEENKLIEDPVECLLRYITDNSKAHYAIADMNDVSRLYLGETDIDLSTLKQRLNDTKPKIVVDEDRTGYLSFDDILPVQSFHFHTTHSYKSAVIS